MLLENDAGTFPLVETFAQATVLDDEATVLITQTFLNPGHSRGVEAPRPKPIIRFWKKKQDVQKIDRKNQAFYSFPLQSNAAVFFFKTTFFSSNGKELKVLRGIATKNEDAVNDFLRAKKKGLAANLLTQDFENSPDVFKISVANISSNVKTVEVQIAYCVPLYDEGNGEKPKLEEEEQGVAKRFLIPVVIGSRYGDLKTEPWWMPNISTRERIFKVLVRISLSYDISSVHSPSHNVKIKAVKDSPAKKLVTFETAAEKLQGDFVLSIVGQQAASSALLVQQPYKSNDTRRNNTFPTEFGDATVAKLTFKCADSSLAGDDAIIRQNFVFLVDRSGSMAGSRMDNCKKALKRCLKSLPENCEFNICSFGSTHKYLFDESQDYSENVLNIALAHVEAMTADMIGTEILVPLREIVQSHSSGLPKVVFVLTDGEVTDTEGVVETMRLVLQTHKAKFFTCGIGSGVSTHLIEQLAKAGGGIPTFITLNEDFKAKLISQMEQGVYPTFEDLRVDMSELRLSKARLAWDINSTLPSSVVSGETLSYFVVVENSSVIEIQKKLDDGTHVQPIRLTGVREGDQSRKRITVAEIIVYDKIVSTEADMQIPALCEQVRLAELEEGETAINKAVELCVMGNLVSKYTSLVAVEEVIEEPEEVIEEPEQEVEIENAPQDMGGAAQAVALNEVRSRANQHDKTQHYVAAAKKLVRSEPVSPSEKIQNWQLGQKVSSWVPNSGIGTRIKKRDLGTSEQKMVDPLVELQNLNGSFKESPELAKLIGKEDFGINAGTHGFATAVAIVFAEKKLGKVSPGWKLFQRKAMRYLEKHVQKHNELLEKARRFLMETDEFNDQAFLHKNFY